MKNIKYISVILVLTAFVACNEPEDVLKDTNIELEEVVELPQLVTGSADFSNYVALGASFTSGFTDGALFKAAQDNSFPNTLSKQFANANGGMFNQPLMNDNTGGMIIPIPGVDDLSYRLVFNGSGPQRLDDFFTDLGAPAPTITTNAAVSLAADGSIFKNVGVPGAKSTHIDFNGYASLNPYFGRMANSPTVSMLEYAIDQSPTFFTLSEIGGNDVLGYATSGGDGTDPITPATTFDFVFNDMVNQLTMVCPNGVVTNIPYITDLPHFTTVPYNALDPSNPALAPQIATLNAQLYGALDNIFTAFGEPDRVNILSATEANPILINDENAEDRSIAITGALTPVLGAPTATLFGQLFGKARQSTANDLFVLPSRSAIATAVAGVPAPVNINGVSFPMADKWVLTPEEQLEIKIATDAYNTTIASAANSKGLAFVDLNAILTQASSTGIAFDDYNLSTNLVTGGLVSLDGIHLTARGYAFMANKFLEAIDLTYGSNFVASGNVSKAEDFNVIYSPTLQ